MMLFVVTVSAETTYRLDRFVKTGKIAPAPPQLSFILNTAFNDRGQVAFVADGGLLLKSGDQLRVIASPSTAAPGGGTYVAFNSVSLNGKKQILFDASVTPPSTSGLFLFSQGEITQLVAEGSIASTGESVSPSSGLINDAGDVVFVDSNAGLYLLAHNTSTIVRLAGVGEAAPGGGTFSTFVGFSLNKSGQVAFHVFLAEGGDGVYLASGGSISKIIKTGDSFPDGGTFSFATDPSINDSGKVAFGGLSGDSLADSGVFLYSAGTLQVVVPRITLLPDGTSLDAGTSIAALNNAGQVAFTAFLSSGLGTTGAGTFLFSNGTVSEITATGHSSPDGDIFGIGELSAFINNSGQVLVLSSLMHHTDALYLFAGNQLSRVAGQGDTINKQPRFLFPSAVGMDSAGEVLFGDSTFPGGSGVFLASSAGEDLVAHVGQPLGSDVISFLFGEAIGPRGDVAVLGTTSSNTPFLFEESGGTVTEIAGGSTSNGVTPRVGALGSPAVNSLGEIAFLGSIGGQFSSDLYLASGGQISLLLPAGAPTPDGGSLGEYDYLAVNRNHKAAFQAQPNFPSSGGIFAAANFTITPLAENGASAPGGGTFSFFFPNPRFGPAINDNDDVAFAVSLSTGGSGVFLSSGDSITRIAGPGDPAPDGDTFITADNPSINSSGLVAFWGITSTFHLGVFLYSNGAISPVALAGDPVGNLILGFVDHPKINDDGRIAFDSGLSNGDTGLLVAIPKKNQHGHAQIVSFTSMTDRSAYLNKVIQEHNQRIHAEELQNHDRRKHLQVRNNN